jgi:hypothetical protein
METEGKLDIPKIGGPESKHSLAGMEMCVHCQSCSEKNSAKRKWDQTNSSRKIGLPLEVHLRKAQGAVNSTLSRRGRLLDTCGRKTSTVDSDYSRKHPKGNLEMLRRIVSKIKPAMFD